MKTQNKGGRPKMRGTKNYTVKLSEQAAEWAKENGGLTELLRDCLDTAYKRSVTSQGQTLHDKPTE